MEQVHALAPVILLLLVGILAIALMRSLGLSPIVGYLAAGLIIGPHALGLRPTARRRACWPSSASSFSCSTSAAFLAAEHLGRAPRHPRPGAAPDPAVRTGVRRDRRGLGYGTHYAIILGGMLALSSTAVVVQTLAERGQQNCPVGLTGTAILIFQDICAIFILILATSIEDAGSSSERPSRSRFPRRRSRPRSRVHGGSADRPLRDQAALPLAGAVAQRGDLHRDRAADHPGHGSRYRRRRSFSRSARSRAA